MPRVKLNEAKEVLRLREIVGRIDKDKNYFYKNKFCAIVGAAESQWMQYLLYDLEKCYDALGSSHDASLQNVNTYYRAAASLFHTDKFPNMPEAQKKQYKRYFIVIQTAKMAIDEIQTQPHLEQAHDGIIATKNTISGVYDYLIGQPNATEWIAAGFNKRSCYAAHRCLLVLGLPPDAKDTQVKKRYNDLHSDYQSKLEKATVGSEEAMKIQERIELIDEASSGFQHLMKFLRKSAIVSAVIYTAIGSGFGFGLYKYSKELPIIPSAKNIALTAFFSVTTLMFSILVICCVISAVKCSIDNSVLSAPSTILDKPQEVDTKQNDMSV